MCEHFRSLCGRGDKRWRLARQLGPHSPELFTCKELKFSIPMQMGWVLS